MRKFGWYVAALIACAPAVVSPATPVKLWGKTIGGSSGFNPVDGATVADVDGDGRCEVLVASTDGKCYVWRHDGSTYSGFPKQVHKAGIFFQHTPAVGDIDGDGDAEIVIGARGVSIDGALYAWHHDGTPVAGFPIDNIYISGTVALYDLDGDGADEIIAAERRYPTGTLHVFTGKGREFPGWPRVLYGLPLSGIAVGDIDGDKKAEILLGSTTEGGKPALFAWNAGGTAVPGFPFETKTPFNYAAPALADFDNDGRLEIAFGLSYDTADEEFYVLEGNGRVAPGWPKRVEWVWATASAGDIDRDGYLEIIGRELWYDCATYVWNYDGSRVPGFPVPRGGGNATVADVDGDGRLEIICDTDYQREGIYAFKHDGSIAEGFPLAVSGNPYLNAPAVWDIDGDGALELVAVSCNNQARVFVDVYRLGGKPRSPVWPMYNHDQRHTACYDTKLGGIGIVLDYFCARAEGEAVLVRWATASEWNHAGFNLYRVSSRDNAAKAKLNAELIRGKSPYRYVDRDLEAGVEYEYWLEAVDLKGNKETYGPVYCTAGGAGKASFALAQNVPNPARTAATIAFSVPAACEAVLSLYDLAGRNVASRGISAKAGDNEVALDVSALPPGLYIYRLQAGGEAAARKLVVYR